MAKPDGGQAFPSIEIVEMYSEAKQQYVAEKIMRYGMSLRDYFAAQAIAGHADHQGHAPSFIRDAYAIADAMLAEREK